MIIYSKIQALPCLIYCAHAQKKTSHLIRCARICASHHVPAQLTAFNSIRLTSSLPLSLLILQPTS
jgi:hypothetical protein